MKNYTMFRELLENIKEFCDEKDSEIYRLKNEIEGLKNQREKFREEFLKGNYEGLKWYFE